MSPSNTSRPAASLTVDAVELLPAQLTSGNSASTSTESTRLPRPTAFKWQILRFRRLSRDTRPNVARGPLRSGELSPPVAPVSHTETPCLVLVVECIDEGTETMALAADALALALAGMLTLSAALKIERNERSVHVVHELARVPLTLFPALAGVEVAAAAGLVVGIWSTTLGIAASAGAVAYFVGAMAAHVAAGHVSAVSKPLPPALLAGLALAFRIAAR